MTAKRDLTDTGALEAAVREFGSEFYELVLFVSGTTPNSVRAIFNTRQLCETRLVGRHSLTIVDLYQQPELAKREQIIAAPTLLRRLPRPTKRLVGTMVNASQILLSAPSGGGPAP